MALAIGMPCALRTATMRKPKKIAAKKTAAKKSKDTHGHTTGKFRIDKRAGAIVGSPASVGPDDECLTTQEVATWLGVSRQFLEIGRSRNYGPPFSRLGPGVIMYRRDAVRKWLRSRDHNHTAEYMKKHRASMVGA